MIFLGLKDKDIARQLGSRLQTLGAGSYAVTPSDKRFMDALYDASNSAIITEAALPGLPEKVAMDVLNSLGRRIPVVVLSRSVEREGMRKEGLILDQVTVLSPDKLDEIPATLGMIGALSSETLLSTWESIPYFNLQTPVRMLKEFGGLGLLTIDTSGFGKVGLEYGIDVYARLKEVFQTILFEMWGRAGCFRETDVICRKSASSNIYYVFLNRSRQTGSLPYPGALETVADRLCVNLQNSLWNELNAPRSRRRLPDCISAVPIPSVGFIAVIDNPCIEAHEIIENGLEDARRVALAQMRRVKERQLELMQTMIQSENFLRPAYQGVFYLQDLDRGIIEETHERDSISLIADQIFGFESLIRVNQEEASRVLRDSGDGVVGLDPRYLRPDVLFSMAKATKVSLELDQACLRHAAGNAKGLPGTLMVNILPRNLYYIDKIRSLFQEHSRLMFEVSESEAINNFELMQKSCAYLKVQGLGIAADDFGKGYSSLERIIKIKPHVIKFDRSMIENIHKDPIKQAYVRGMVAAAKILKTTVLAEGVELWEEAEVLKAMGIELVQGFLLHKPQSAEDILHQLRNTHLSTVA